MNHKPSSSDAPSSLSRRAALKRAITGGLSLAALTAPAIEAADAEVAAPPETFVPENDYPFFDSDETG